MESFVVFYDLACHTLGKAMMVVTLAEGYGMTLHS